MFSGKCWSSEKIDFGKLENSEHTRKKSGISPVDVDFGK
jgi:hypothetical protein